MPNFLRISGDPKSVLGTEEWSPGELIDTLTDRAKIFVFSYSPALKSLISWSKNAPQILGVRDIMVARDGNLFLRHVHPDDRFLLLTDLERALRGELEYRATYRWIRPDNNEVHWLHCRAGIRSSGPERLFEGVIIDLSEEFLGSVSKIAGPDSISTVLSAFPTMVFTLDHDRRLLRVNRPKQHAPFNFGDENFLADQFRIGRPFLGCFRDEKLKHHFQQILSDLLEARIPSFRTRIVSGPNVYNLELGPLNEANTIAGILGIVSDVTEVVKLERQLADLQKTEGLRLLAAGVAHHFNNALQSIVGQAAAINSQPENSDLVSRSANAILEIAKRSAELTRHLVQLDEAKSDSTSRVDVNLAAMSAVSRIDDLFTSGIKVAIAFGNPGPVIANHEKLSEAFQEIIHNAKESMSEGGSLTLKTFQVFLPEYAIDDLKVGTYALLSITDSGTGMSRIARQRCFEPFFTTRNQPQNSDSAENSQGLGLSHAFGLIRNFGGAITVESTQGLGTTVSVYLPLAEQISDAANANPSKNSASDFAPDILIVDDDQMVLDTVGKILGEAGYHCLGADSPTRALALFQQHQMHIQLILLDAVMPGMSGATLLQKIKKLAPNIRVVGFSGAPPEHTQALLDNGAILVIRKPADPKTLTKTIQEVLAPAQAA